MKLGTVGAVFAQLRSQLEAPTRRHFPYLALLVALAVTTAGAAPRPNVLWITSEDNSPYLGCYGDALAQTPHLDRLASQGVRYRHAFANVPVCSPARTTLITGMYASSLGLQHHRSRVRIPPAYRLYPEYLRQAGYYCTNNSKTDYNVADVGEPWDESSPQAHYKNRKADQPFFAIFNLTASHEGQLTEEAVSRRRSEGLLPRLPRLPPEQVRLPPYHADTPVVRRDWSVYYDNLTLMDQQAGELLKELEESGLAEDTIVFYYSDHGGALPRGKRNIHDSGTRVPLIIRFPPKWAHLAPASAGEWVDDLVSFVDFPATLLSLTGVSIPHQFEGRAFLGDQKAAPREHVFLLRGRMDERYDTVRAVRDGRFRYVRNYSPHLPWGQYYSYPFRVMPSMSSWYEACRGGNCNPAQARYWQEKPPEELYDLSVDPFEINNLADEPGYAGQLAGLRRALDGEMAATRDTGLIPEGMFERLAGAGTIYEYAQSDSYPLQRILEIAALAASRDPEALPALLEALEHSHPVIRYWAATGCLILKGRAAAAREQLRARLADEWADVRVAAAQALAHLGETEAAVETLEKVIQQGGQFEVLAALTALESIWESGRVGRERVRQILKDRRFEEPEVRIAERLLNAP